MATYTNMRGTISVEIGDDRVAAAKAARRVIPDAERVKSVRAICESCDQYKPVLNVVCASANAKKCGCSGRGIIGMIRHGCPLKKW